MRKLHTKTIVSLGVLTALEIVLSRFLSISAWNIKLGFSFVPIAAAAMLFGAVPAGIVAALGDFLGALLFPVGPYFPGFTLTAFLSGVVFGLFLHKKRTPARVALAVAVHQLPLSLGLNTLWISILYSSPFLPLLSARLIQCAVLAPVMFVVLVLLGRAADAYGRRLYA